MWPKVLVHYARTEAVSLTTGKGFSIRCALSRYVAYQGLRLNRAARQAGPEVELRSD
jgi:hypothetical protein